MNEQKQRKKANVSSAGRSNCLTGSSSTKLITVFLILLFGTVSAFAQNGEHQVNGTVIDSDGESLIGVNVFVQGTSKGTTTNADGEFSLTVSNENSVLVFSYVGFTTQEIAIEGRSTIEVTLQSGTAQLDDLVVVGYGTQRRSEITGSVGMVSEEDLRIQEQQFFHSERVIDGQLYEFELSPYLYHDTEALFETNRGVKNMNVYRYAEVLLIAAEAIARSEGVSAEAVGYLADVRSRAYWQTDRSAIVAELSGLSVEDFVEEVWKERIREFALEFKIWTDIQRTRQYPTTSEANPGEVEFVTAIGHTNPWGSTYQEHHLLFPISDDELQRNPSLTQNDGYGN